MKANRVRNKIRLGGSEGEQCVGVKNKSFFFLLLLLGPVVHFFFFLATWAYFLESL